MRLFRYLFVFVVLLGLGEGTAGAAERRVALVLGNSAYQNVPNLKNPARDAEAIGALLRAAGFDAVQVYNDVSVTAMRKFVRDFSEQARDAGIALIYYAGHGIEVGGNNYLIPVDASLRRDIDVEDETVPLDRLLQVTESAKRLRLVILDACRDNPFARSMARTMASRAIGRGLARVEPVTSDTLIAFAAKAGSTARDGEGLHSPFTASLLKNLVTPGLDVRLALGRVRDEVMLATNKQQEPFVYGSLGGATVTLDSADASSPVAPETESLGAAAKAYDAAGRLGTKEAWNAFLDAHPAGFYAALARQQLAKLNVGRPTPPAIPPKAAKSIQPDATKKDREKKLSGNPLQECLASYVRRRGPFRPEGQSDANYKSRSDMTSMCNLAIAHGNYYWRYQR